jgi:hypothetical protein
LVAGYAEHRGGRVFIKNERAEKESDKVVSVLDALKRHSGETFLEVVGAGKWSYGVFVDIYVVEEAGSGIVAGWGDRAIGPLARMEEDEGFSEDRYQFGEDVFGVRVVEFFGVFGC